jgi:hypothetical protein
MTTQPQPPGPKQPPRIHGEGCTCGDFARKGCPVAQPQQPTTEQRCRRCGTPILRLDTTERTSSHIWHEDEGTCIDRLRMRNAELEAENKAQLADAENVRAVDAQTIEDLQVELQQAKASRDAFKLSHDALMELNQLSAGAQREMLAQLQASKADGDRFVKLVRLKNLCLDDKLTEGFINAEVDCRTLDDWRRYLDTVDETPRVKP